MKTNVDFINSQEEGINKSKEKDKNNNNKNDLLKTEKKKEKNNYIMNIVKENIENENNSENKEQSIKDNTNSKDIQDINKNDNLDKNEEKKEEDPVISHAKMKETISDEDIKNASKLILEEIEGNLFNGKKIEINAGGMVGGRGKKDGFAIFSKKNSVNQENQKKEEDNENHPFIPDYELNYEEDLSYPYIFAIYYKKEEKSYYIRAFSGKGSENKILFIKLKNDIKFILKQRELISIGDTIFQISPIENNFLEIIHLERKNNHNISHKQIFEGKKGKKVTLGRSKECDFAFPKDKSFSRFQTTFEFDDTKKEWTIFDGKENKSSTNGTWIFGTHSFLIKEEMILEILNSKIIIKEIKNEEDNGLK